MTSKELTETLVGEITTLVSEMNTINEWIHRAEKAGETHSKAFVIAQNAREDAKMEISRCLARIKAGELWREDGARSWSGWIKAGGAEAVQFLGGVRRADQLVASVPVVEETRTKTGFVPNEGQARELLNVPEEQRVEVVERAAETGKVTARAIKEAAKEVQAGTPRRGPDPKPSEVRTAAWKADFLKALKIAVRASSPEEVLSYTREKLET